jgi:hypothetical protein
MRKGHRIAPMSRVSLIAIAATFSAAGGNAMAEAPTAMTEPPVAMLSGDLEVPPVKTMASAHCNIVVADDMSVSGTIDTTAIEGVAAHIHEGAPGTNGPAIVTLTQATPAQWAVPQGTKFTPQQYASFKAGNLYVNVHSAAHKDGEIRLQLKP